MNEGKWFLYILKYRRTGCYYVGSTPDLEGRMRKHFTGKADSNASVANNAREGFYYYWYDIRVQDQERITNWQSFSNQVEDELVRRLRERSEEIGQNLVVSGGGTHSEISDSELDKIEQRVARNEEFTIEENEVHILEDICNNFTYELEGGNQVQLDFLNEGSY